MRIATSLANEIVTFPFYASQIFVTILVVLKGLVESGTADALVYISWFHGAKVIKILRNSAV
jgi:hypothetical protein